MKYFVLIFFLLISLNANAQTDADRITVLETRIRELETRIEKLEQVKVTSSTNDSQESQKQVQTIIEGDFRILTNWNKIKEGMSYDQVKRILGTPTKTKLNTETSMYWYYEGYVKEAGATVLGNIYFIDGRVQIINEPVY